MRSFTDFDARLAISGPNQGLAAFEPPQPLGISICDLVSGHP
jgi:hypothetical protein